MKIAVFGATGMAGSAIVAEGLARGHHLTGVARTPQGAVTADRLTSCALDVGDTAAVDSVLATVDTAVLTIRLRPGAESELAALTGGFLDVAGRRGTRVLVVGGAAPLRSPDDTNRLLIDDRVYVPEVWRPVAAASLEQFHLCRNHTHRDWVYLSPPAVLEPGTRSGRYRRGTDTLLTDADGASRISAADLAIAVLDELESPGDVDHFTVAEDRTP
ncbi:NAD(P)-dependent oxidoreductase [Flexivirga sp. B27]